MFKKGIIWCLILAMLLGTMSVCAEEMAKAQKVVVAEAVQEDEGLLSKEGEGAPVEKRIVRVQFEVFKNGAWRRATSVTLAQGEFIPVRVMHIYSGSSAYDTDVYNSNTNVAKIVSIEGIPCIVGFVPGTAKFTAHERYYNKKATLKVKVTPAKVTDIELTSSYFEVPMGKIFNLGEHVTVLPEFAANKAVTYKSSNKKVATVDKNGYVTPKQFGTTTITITSKQNKKTKIYCTIAVLEDAPDNPVDYRFVGIGQADYSGSTPDLPSCYNDVVMMYNAFKAHSLDGNKIKSYDGYYNCTGAGIRSILSGMASCGADENDVTVFYYSGHGAASDTASYRGALCGVDDTYVTVEEVRRYLDKVPGTVIVILDSCLSGQFIQSKSLQEQKTLANQYAQSVIGTFASSTAKNYDPKALPDSPYASKYKILTACQPLQYSMGWSDYGVFTYYALAGIGYDADGQTYCQMHADANNNKEVSLKELYNLVEAGVALEREKSASIDQITMVWPANDNTVVLAKN